MCKVLAIIFVGSFDKQLWDVEMNAQGKKNSVLSETIMT